MIEHKLNKMLKVYINSPLQKYCPTQQIHPNYHLSVASVDSSITESTYIFLETLNKRINEFMENTSKTKITY